MRHVINAIKNKLFSCFGIILATAITFGTFLLASQNVWASTPIDEILNYEITADVNEDDATVRLRYHIDWRVLDDTKEGALTWVKIGIPNSRCSNITALSDNIESIKDTSSGGDFVEVYFTSAYFEDEVVSFEFEITQDNLYLVNKEAEGFTTYSFTPGWFDDINVDNLIIRWNSDRVSNFSPECFNEGGYLIWNASLNQGERYTVTVTYPNDAYGFNLNQTEENFSEYGHGKLYDYIIGGLSVIFVLILVGIGIAAPIAIASLMIYLGNSGFKAVEAAGKTKKVTRTKIVYYPSCQGCGAVRKENEKFCTYCGRSFVKSEEKVEENAIKPDEKGLLKFKEAGEFRYSSDPNSYVRVSVVHVPFSQAYHAVEKSHASRPRSGGHSSCAHSSCACACACACAGGGRAGCTTKDFYKTELKLRGIHSAIEGKNHK